MIVRFPNQVQRWDADELEISFPAQIDGKTVKCRISWEAMQDAFQCRGASSDVLAAFRLNRKRIEVQAERVILATRFEADGTVLLRSGDF